MTMPPPPGRPDLDQALKRLLQQAHDGLLALLTPELHWRGERSPELPAVARQADLVWEVEDSAGTRGLLHIELQTKPDPEMGERLAEYLIRLWRRDHLPVRSIVIFLRAIPRVPQPPFVLKWMGSEVPRCHYQVVRLSGTRMRVLPAERVLETPHVGLWPLAGLMANMRPELALTAAERIATAPVTRQEQSELVGLLTRAIGVRHACNVRMIVLDTHSTFESMKPHGNPAIQA